MLAIVTFRSARRMLCAGLVAGIAWTAAIAHGGAAGEVQIGHPYATPSPAGAVNGVAYLAFVVNNGKAPDRLLRASASIAERVELHTMALDAGGVMRMREAGDLALPPGERISMQPGVGYHLMLMGLKQPLKLGEQFAMTFEFERGGRTEVMVVVQKTTDKAMTHDAHTAH